MHDKYSMGMLQQAMLSVAGAVDVCCDETCLAAYPLKRRGFLANQIGQCAVCQSNHDMDSRYSPGKGKVVEDCLVLQIEGHIEPIPASQYAT